MFIFEHNFDYIRTDRTENYNDVYISSFFTNFGTYKKEVVKEPLFRKKINPNAETEKPYSGNRRR